jgi:glycosyltransferase involved in cell wall biosynthesis
MKIGFVFTHPHNESMGSLVRVRELSNSLMKLGHEVCLFTPFGERMEWDPRIKIYPISTLNSSFNRSTYRYLRRILRSPILAKGFLARPEFLERIAAHLSAGILRVLKDNSLDLDVIQGEQEIAALGLLQIRDKISIPISVDLHNIWAEELAIQNNLRRDKSTFINLQKLENRIIKNSDMCIVISDAMKDYIETTYGDGCRIEIVPPGSRVRTDEVPGKSGPPRVAFAGLLTHREHVDLFVESMPHIKKTCPDTQFFITGRGEEFYKIRKLCTQIKVDPHFFWFEHSSNFYNFLQKCHLGALPSSNDISRRIGTPVKLFDYLSVGMPVVANDIGSWSEIISRFKVGILTNEDPSSFSSGILEFLQRGDYIEECGKRGIDLIRTKYNWDNSARLLIEAHKRIAS